MIRTKKAKKVLTKEEQQHLSEVNIHSMAALESQIGWMKKKQPKDPWMICLDCWRIAKKLGIF